MALATCVKAEVPTSCFLCGLEVGEPQLLRVAAFPGIALHPHCAMGLAADILDSLRTRDMAVRTPARPTAPDLTPSERRVLGLIAGGYANKEIARVLGRRPSTVKNVVSAVLTKLDVASRTEAALLAVSLGLTEANPHS